MPSRVEVLFIDESDFVNKGIGFILGDCSYWDPYHINFNFALKPRLEEKKKHQKANRGVGIIVAENNQSSQTSILVKRRRRAIRTKTLKCKQITADIKTGKQQKCY